MASIRTAESIPKLSKLSVSTVQLPSGLRVNVGAQQYVSTGAITLSTGTSGLNGLDHAQPVTASSIYTVYAVVSSSVVYLIASLNSSLPAGYSQARAVGGFSVNSSSQVDQVASTPGDLNVLGTGSFVSGLLAPPVQNFIINGGFDFWQRGTAETNPGGAHYWADRFGVSSAGGATLASSKQTDFTGIPGIANALKVRTTATALGQYLALNHVVEGYNYQALHGKTVTLSFWVKMSLTGTYSVNFRRLVGGATWYTYSAPFTVSVAGTWEFKSITLTMTSSILSDVTNGYGLGIVWGLQAGSLAAPSSGSWLTGNYIGLAGQTNLASIDTNQYMEIAGVMLNIGTSAAPFSRQAASIGGELLLCQRYYEKSCNPDVAPASGINLAGCVIKMATSAVQIQGVNFRVEKRATPTVMRTWGGSTGTLDKVSVEGAGDLGGTTAANYLGTNGAGTFLNITGMTPGTSYSYGWYCDAEI